MHNANVRNSTPRQRRLHAVQWVGLSRTDAELRIGAGEMTRRCRRQFAIRGYSGSAEQDAEPASIAPGLPLRQSEIVVDAAFGSDKPIRGGSGVWLAPYLGLGSALNTWRNVRRTLPASTRWYAIANLRPPESNHEAPSRTRICSQSLATRFSFSALPWSRYS